MARSSILGIDPVATEAPGRDTASLGPSDSSDSGSDLMGLEDGDAADPDLPTDVAMRDDQPHPLQAPEGLDAASDAAGTGERRSAGADSGRPEGSDIGVDRVFTPGEAELGEAGEAGEAGEIGQSAAPDEAEDPDLAFVDLAEAGDPLDDEDADAEGDGEEGEEGEEGGEEAEQAGADAKKRQRRPGAPDTTQVPP